MQRRWETQEVQGDTVVLRVCDAISAGDLLAQLFCSKEQARKVFSRAGFRRGGMALQASDMLLPAELLELALLAAPPPAICGGASNPTVVYQDRLLMAVDKPTGILVHGDGTGAPTLTTYVQSLLTRQGVSTYAQAVQRLDVGTSGLVLFSLTQEFQPALDAQVAGHDMRKQYLAIVEGTTWPSSKKTHRLSWPIARDRHDAKRMRVGAGGKPSVTLVRVLHRARGRTLLQVELQTGRRHQIRVHLAHAGHPLVGDELYGGSSCSEGLMLHAWRECITHPLTGETLELETAWPKRFEHMGFAHP